MIRAVSKSILLITLSASWLVLTPHVALGNSTGESCQDTGLRGFQPLSEIASAADRQRAAAIMTCMYRQMNTCEVLRTVQPSTRWDDGASRHHRYAVYTRYCPRRSSRLSIFDNVRTSTRDRAGNFNDTGSMGLCALGVSVFAKNLFGVLVPGACSDEMRSNALTYRSDALGGNLAFRSVRPDEYSGGYVSYRTTPPGSICFFNGGSTAGRSAHCRTVGNGHSEFYGLDRNRYSDFNQGEASQGDREGYPLTDCVTLTDEAVQYVLREFGDHSTFNPETNSCEGEN